MECWGRCKPVVVRQAFFGEIRRAYTNLIGKTNKGRTKDEQRTNKGRTKDEQRTNKRRTKDEQRTVWATRTNKE